MIKLEVKGKRALFKRKRDNYGNTVKKKKVINYLRRELQSSTTHGLPYIVSEQINTTEKLFWVFNFLICVGVMVYLLTAQLARFVETPTVMSVEMDYFNWNVSYPAFTLCPLIKPDAEAYTDIVSEFDNKTGQNLSKYIWTIISANIKTIDVLDLNPSELTAIDPKDYIEIASKTFRKIPDDSLTTNTNQPINVDVAMTELGMCHVINSNVAMFHNPSKWNNSLTSMPYSSNNIQLSVHDKDFFTQIMNYAENYEDKASVEASEAIYSGSTKGILTLHHRSNGQNRQDPDPDEMILGTTSSYTVTSEGFMSFGVQVWSTKISEVLRRFPVRLRKCRFINEPIGPRYPVYTYSNCMLECRIKIITKLCACVPHFYKPLDHERICNVNELKCILKYKKEILSLSASENTRKHFRYTEKLPLSSRDCACLNNCETDMYLKDYENFVPDSAKNRVRIGISTFPRLRTVKDIIFSINEIVLKSGGVVNLCIGSSVLSLVKFTLVFIRYPIANIFRRFKRGVEKLKK